MPGKRLTKRSTKDLYQEITDKIIELLASGVKPWNKSWQTDPMALGMPLNPTTENHYHGINVVLLLCDPKAMQTGDPRWCSYKQAQAKEWQVKKGERGTPIYFFTVYERAPRNSEEEAQTVESEKEPGKKVIRYSMLKKHTVFHASQIDGIPQYTAPAVDPNFKPIEEIESMVKNTGVLIQHGGNRAFYSPSTDSIQLPYPQYFENEESYGKVKLHELAHWTGNGEREGDKMRVPRRLRHYKGSEGYAFEELIAELSAAFMFARLGIANDIDYDKYRQPQEGLEDTAAYIQSWLKVLKDDNKAIVRAASDAQKVSDFCLRFSPHIAGENAIEWEAQKPQSIAQKIILGQAEAENDNTKPVKKSVDFRTQEKERRSSDKGKQTMFDWWNA